MERSISETGVTTKTDNTAVSNFKHQTLMKQNTTENKDAQQEKIFQTCSSSSSEVDENQNIKEELDSDCSEEGDLLQNVEVCHTECHNAISY